MRRRGRRCCWRWHRCRGDGGAVEDTEAREPRLPLVRMYRGSTTDGWAWEGVAAKIGRCGRADRRVRQRWMVAAGGGDGWGGRSLRRVRRGRMHGEGDPFARGRGAPSMVQAIPLVGVPVPYPWCDRSGARSSGAPGTEWSCFMHAVTVLLSRSGREDPLEHALPIHGEDGPHGWSAGALREERRRTIHGEFVPHGWSARTEWMGRTCPMEGASAPLAWSARSHREQHRCTKLGE